MNLQRSALVRLPGMVTTTIGREQEIQEGCALLWRQEVRLLTLTGPGGVGKTRLSVEIARAMQEYFPDGCIFVSLGSLLDQEHVLPAIAQALGVEQSLSLFLTQRLLAFLAEKRLLLILDNFEHLQGASLLLAELLSSAPDLKLLVTSRARLHLYGEHEYAVPPLRVPDLTGSPSLEELAEVAAVVLFVERAQAVRTQFVLNAENAPMIAEICVRLDGLPLAIELAAARIKYLAPQELLPRLYSILTGGAINLPPRQRTLRATLDWSYGLLSEEEQYCFRHLSLLLGNWRLSAAEALCKELCVDEIEIFEMVSSLVDKSLMYVVETVSGELSFSFLRTIREYAVSCLQVCGEEEVTRRIHARFFLEVVEQAQPHLRGKQQSTWLQKLSRDDVNIWAALHWLIERNEVGLALRFGSALSDFLLVRSELSEGYDWCEEILVLSHNEQAMRERASVLYTAGVVALMRSDLVLAETRLLESEKMAAQTGDRRVEVIAIGMQAQVVQQRGRNEEAQVCIERGLLILEETEDRWYRGIFYSCAGNVASKFCDFKGARRYYQMSLKDLRGVGDTRSEAEVLLQMGQMLRVWGKLRAASILYKRGLRIFQGVADRWSQAACLNALGSVQRLQGRYSEAEQLLQECLQLTFLTGNKREQVVALCELGLVAADQMQLLLAQERCKESLKVVGASGSQPHLLALVLCVLGNLELVQGDLANAEAYLEQALKIARNCADKIRIIAALSGLGAIARQQKEALRAFAFYKQALLFCREVQDGLGYVQLFEEFALLCWQCHLPEQAITLFSFGHNLRAVLELASVPRMLAQRETALATLRKEVGEKIYQECWRTGATLTIEIALSEVARLHFSERKPGEKETGQSGVPAGLTSRELEVLRLVSAGYSDARIASELVLSPRTINAHLRSIYAKVGVSSRSAATRFAFEQKIVT